MIKVSVGDITLMCETVAEFFELAPYVEPFRRFVAPLVTVASPRRRPLSPYPADRLSGSPDQSPMPCIEDTL